MQRKTPLSYMPLISIVVPAYETAEAFLRELMEAVISQTYENWELCIADGSKSDSVEEIVKEYQCRETRILYHRLVENGGISENTNVGFQMAKGEYIAMMDHDDLIPPNALYEMAACLEKSYKEEQRKFALIYSDEDKIDHSGKIHSRPHFKPDYNPEFLRRNNYFCHFLMFAKELLQETKGLRSEYDGAQDYDFVLRCVEAGAIISHVPKILYHWRIHEGSTAGNSADKSYAFDLGCRAIEGHLERVSQPAKAATTANLGVYQVKYQLKGYYRLTVFTEEEQEGKRIEEHYRTEECCRENNTQGYVLDIHYGHGTGLNKETLDSCSGDYILFIRKGVHPKVENLIENLLSICSHKQVGVVSAKLYTKKNRVVSCGLIYGRDGEFVPACGGMPREYKGYFLHGVITQNVSAVMFSCVMIKKEAYALCKEESFLGVYQDADICFQMQEAGYQVITTPDAEAIVGLDERDMQQKSESFVKKWRKKLEISDPCYNENLSLKYGKTYSMKDVR